MAGALVFWEPQKGHGGENHWREAFGIRIIRFQKRILKGERHYSGNSED